MLTQGLRVLFVVLLAFSAGAFSQELISKAVDSGKPASLLAKNKKEALAQVASTNALVTDKININSASALELAKALKGVGPKKAAAIVAFRDLHGPFPHVQELEEVKGIGAVLFARNKDKLALN